MPVFRNDPYPAGNFEITVVGISDDGKAVKGSFSEISGLGVDISVIEYRTGSEDITTRKLPGLKKFSNLVLKRGVIGDATFWNWLAAAMNGQVVRGCTGSLPPTAWFAATTGIAYGPAILAVSVQLLRCSKAMAANAGVRIIPGPWIQA